MLKKLKHKPGTRTSSPLLIESFWLLLKRFQFITNYIRWLTRYLTQVSHPSVFSSVLFGIIRYYSVLSGIIRQVAKHTACWIRSRIHESTCWQLQSSKIFIYMNWVQNPDSTNISLLTEILPTDWQNLVHSKKIVALIKYETHKNSSSGVLRGVYTGCCYVEY